MALVQHQSLEHSTAFGHIHQAIQEDDLWTAALCMWKFLQAPHVLSKRETKLLRDEYDFRVRMFEEKVDLLKRMSRGHAREDFEEWFENGKTFPEIKQKSNAKHQFHVGRLLVKISTYGRSVGYLHEIINMKPSLNKTPEEENTYRLEVMGKSPGLKNIETSKTVFNDWVLICREEAGEGDYQGREWTIIELPSI